MAAEVESDVEGAITSSQHGYTRATAGSRLTAGHEKVMMVVV